MSLNKHTNKNHMLQSDSFYLITPLCFGSLDRNVDAFVNVSHAGLERLIKIRIIVCITFGDL